MAFEVSRMSIIDSAATVYLVDDESSVTKSLEWLLASVSLRVKTYQSAGEFLRYYRAATPGCLVLDVRMPGMSGLELMEHLQKCRIRIPIIFLSAHGDVPMAVQAIKSGAVDFLQKPFATQKFLDCVNHALRLDCEARQRQEAAAERAAGLAALTRRELEIAKLVAAGGRSKEIGDRLGISHKTVDVHRSHIMRKLGARTNADLVRLVEKCSPDSGPE